jgi:hypothetical protein
VAAAKILKLHHPVSKFVPGQLKPCRSSHIACDVSRFNILC